MSDNKIKVGIINLGINNIFSITNAYKKIGCEVKIINKKRNLSNFNIVVIPGIGSFKNGMRKLKLLKIQDDLKKFLENPKRHLIGICLGMQLFFEFSYEFGKIKGMGLIKGSVIPFDIKKTIKKTNNNWNDVIFKNKLFFKKISNKKFYFTHSFFCKPLIKKEIYALTNFNKFNYCSIVKKDNIIGLQMHPEKSGKNGLELLMKINNFL